VKHVGRALRGRGGYTLIELLAVLTIFLIVVSSLTTLFVSGAKAELDANRRFQAQQSARVAVERLAGEIRTAGLGPWPATFAAISVAEPTHIVLHHDLDGDGVIAGNGETITWRLTGTTLRRDAGGGAQPIIDGVRGFELGYLDAAGGPTQVPNEIRTVVITVVTEAAWDVVERTSVTAFSTRVRLRNR